MPSADEAVHRLMAPRYRAAVRSSVRPRPTAYHLQCLTTDRSAHRVRPTYGHSWILFSRGDSGAPPGLASRVEPGGAFAAMLTPDEAARFTFSHLAGQACILCKRHAGGCAVSTWCAASRALHKNRRSPIASARPGAVLTGTSTAGLFPDTAPPKSALRRLASATGTTNHAGDPPHGTPAEPFPARTP